MTPKDKALEMCQKFGMIGMSESQTGFYTLEITLAKKCAFICVDEILDTCSQGDLDFAIYWQEVKKEIENL